MTWDIQRDGRAWREQALRPSGYAALLCLYRLP